MDNVGRHLQRYVVLRDLDPPQQVLGGGAAGLRGVQIFGGDDTLVDADDLGGDDTLVDADDLGGDEGFRGYEALRGYEAFREYEPVAFGRPDVAIAEVDAQGLAVIDSDPTTRDRCRPMRVSLISPTATRAGTAADEAWGLAPVGALRSRYTGAGVTVAVLDTGIDASHPAFAEAGVELEEQNFTGSGPKDKAEDRHGHGTHCAGTIFGRDVEGRRIGVARGVSRALIGKVMDDNGHGTSEAIFEGLQWALSQGAHVISMSLGFDFPGEVSDAVAYGLPIEMATSQALERYRSNLRMFDSIMTVVRAAEGTGHGCVVVAAAGNESHREVKTEYVVEASVPASAQDVVSVSAAQKKGAKLRIADFSNTNPQICAPGFDILSAQSGGGLCFMSGTSMACPHVAGIAALWWEAAGDKGIPQKAHFVSARLLASAKTSVFAKGVLASDRGVGLASAP